MKNKIDKISKVYKIFFLGIVVFFMIGILLCLKNENIKIAEISKKIEGLDDSILIGEKGYISSSVITQRKTGTGPFDKDDEAGNDSSEDNDIVRSFDQITWTIENNLKLKNEDAGSSYKGGVIQVKAEFSPDISEYIKWDTDSMKWAENVEISDNGAIFSAQYTLSDDEVTLPGKQTLVFVLKVMGAPNETNIQPKFTMSILGNGEDEKFELNDTITKVSAAPNYNIKLAQNNSLANRVTVDYGNGDKIGRMYGYCLVLQLYNEDVNKGLKGIEYPKGEINFDIDLQLMRTRLDSTELENITNDCTPILWNYSVNYRENSPYAYGNIEGRNMIFDNPLTQFYATEPSGLKTSDRSMGVFDSGTLVMTQNGSIINVKVNNYAFDGIFPQYFISKQANSEPIYEKNTGCFSVNYFQIFIPDNEASTLNDRNYYLKVSDKNLNICSASGKIQTKQQIETDDSITFQHVLYRKGEFNHCMYLTKAEGNRPFLSQFATTGDSRAVIGQKIEINSKFNMNLNSDDNINSATKFIKFDGDCVEPLMYDDGKKYHKNSFLGDMTFNVWYITKKDGKNWTSQQEMNEAKIEDMLYYSSIEEIPENYICIGEYLESVNGKITPATGDNNVVSLRLKVKETATIGKTYGFTHTTTNWLNYVDRNLYSIEKRNFSEWPQSIWRLGEHNYIKTEYNENGEIIPGTHNGGWQYGQSLLVMGANLQLSKIAVDENDVEKANYDIGKNEYNVKYKLTPKIEKNIYLQSDIENVNLKIEDKLPKGLRYVSGTSNYDEPECTINNDGTTDLVWYINNCTSGQNITPLTYTAHIEEETLNGTQFTSEAIVSENISNGEISKIGNADAKYRTAKNSIQIINLESYALYKITNTPIVDVEQEVHFRVTAINKTETPISDFKLLDILPYNGDERRTHFNGDYTVSKIVLKESDILTQDELDNNNLKIKITNNENVRTQVSAKDEDLGQANMWTEINSGSILNSEQKGIAVIGELPGKVKLDLDIYIRPTNNKPTDEYNNSATAQTNIETDVIKTPIINVQVVKRTLEGKVWFDKNKNGIIDDNENFIEGEKLTLLNEDGTIARDIDDQEITTVETDENGHYKFENMKKGNYKVKIDYNNSSNYKELTLKNVGSNNEINSKFNDDCYTDLITELNNINSPEIKVNYINAGITLKNSKVTVHHYEEGTENPVILKDGTKANDETIIGKIEDEYETLPADTQDYYELVSTPTNAQGRMKLEETVVTYYYKYKKYPYIVKYIDKDTNEELLPEKYDAGTEYNSIVRAIDEKIAIEKYDFDSSDKETLTISTGKNEIILYYKKKIGSVTVKYIDKNTGVEIAKRENKNDKVDLDYNTTKKEISGYTFIEDTNNTTGKYTVNPINVIYYYKKNTKVTVNYIDKITDNLLDTISNNGLVGDEFTATSKNFENYILVEKPEQETVILTPDEIILNYYYIHSSGGVVEKHIDVFSGEILYNEEHIGKEGDSYNISSKNFEGYDLVTERLPNNANGTMSKNPEAIEVVYYYKYKTDVIAKYIDKITGKDLTTEVKKEGYEGEKYTTEIKTFESYSLDGVPQNANGNLKKETTIVIYYYVHNSAGVKVNHYDIISGEKLKDEQTISGNEGNDYITNAESFEKYDLVEEKIPENATGKMTIEEINVDYYYKHKSKVIVKYIDKITGKQISASNFINGYEQDTYKTKSKEINGYLFTNEIPKNAEGKMKKEITEVIYYYKRPSIVEVSYIDIDTEQEIAERTILEGQQDDSYSTEEKNIKKYKIIKDKYPENSKGEMKVTITTNDKGEETISNTTYVKYYYKKLEANLKVKKEIINLNINENRQNKESKLEKVEINRKQISNTKIQVTYKITIENSGEIETDAILEEIIPNGMQMLQENNKEWTKNGEKAYISANKIKPQEKKEYLFTLDWISNESNMGTLKNQVKLIDVKNEDGIEENNTADNEDYADLVLSISTGVKTYIYIPCIMIAVLTITGIVLLKIRRKL